MKLRLLLVADEVTGALDLGGKDLVAFDAVNVGLGRDEVCTRSDVSSRTRMRTSREARVPLPCVLPSAELWEVETVVQVCCCVS
jgi:hypothetical protein